MCLSFNSAGFFWQKLVKIVIILYIYIFRAHFQFSPLLPSFFFSEEMCMMYICVISSFRGGGGGNLPWFWVRMCGWSPRTPPHSYTRPSEKHDQFIYFPYRKLTPFIYYFWKLTPFIYYFSNFTHSYTFWVKKIPHRYTFDVKMIPIHILGGLKSIPHSGRTSVYTFIMEVTPVSSLRDILNAAKIIRIGQKVDWNIVALDFFCQGNRLLFQKLLEAIKRATRYRNKTF